MKSSASQTSILAVVVLAIIQGACAPGSSVTGVDLDPSPAADETAGVDAQRKRTEPVPTAGTYNLSVWVSGKSPLRISSSPAGIASCSRTAGTCSVRLAIGTRVVLTAAGVKGRPVTWSGDCVGTSPACAVTLDGDRLVIASLN
jgi:hypothetical protein